MKIGMTKKSKIALVGLVIAALMVTTVAAVTVISNTWTSPTLHVTASGCVITSSDWTTDQSVLIGIPFEFHVSITNPNAAGSFTGVMMHVDIYGTSDPTQVWLQYWDYTAATPSWKNITLTTYSGHLTTEWGPATGFPIAAGQTITNYFKFSASVAGDYSGDLYAYTP